LRDRCPGHTEPGTCPLLRKSEPETGIKETGKFPFVIASKAPVIASKAKQSLHLPYGIASFASLWASAHHTPRNDRSPKGKY